MTLGEYRVGITFNPGGNSDVDRIKRAAADFIDLCQSLRRPDWFEHERLLDEAEKLVETAAMHAVKAATKQPLQAAA